MSRVSETRGGSHFEVFISLTYPDDPFTKSILSGDGSAWNFGSVLSHDVGLMKTVKLWNEERSILLLLRNSVLRVSPMTSPRTSLSWGRWTVPYNFAL
jgi:hypothetical protein